MLEQLLSQVTFLDPEDLKHIMSKFTEEHFEKNEYLVKENQINDKIFLIKSGIIREYSKLHLDADADADADADVDKKNTHWILGENEWIFQIRSFIEEKPSQCNIQAIEKTKTYSLLKSDFKQIIGEFSEILPFVLKMYERYLLQMEERNMLQRIKPARKRLIAFENKYPNIASKVPLNILASFINITQSELSRIRVNNAKGRF